MSEEKGSFQGRVAEQRQAVALELIDEVQLLTKQRDALLDACKDFAKGWTHFCKVLNFADSALDADAIRWMNETPPKIGQAIAKATKGIK